MNRSGVKCTHHNDSLLLGLGKVRDVGEESARVIVEERERHGHYSGAGDLVQRTGLKPQAIHSLVMAGAFDQVTPTAGKPCGMRAFPSVPRGTGSELYPCLRETTSPT